MPRTAKKTATKKKKDAPLKYCPNCAQEKPFNNFYQSASPKFKDKLIPLCKECCKTYAIKEDGTIDYPRFKELLFRIDKPLFYDSIIAAETCVSKEYPQLSESDLQRLGKEIVSRYFRNVSLAGLFNLTYDDSFKSGFIYRSANKIGKAKAELTRKFELRFNTGQIEELENPLGFVIDEFEVTQDIVDMFGEGYLPSQYKKMSEKYESLRQNYMVQTTLHQEALITYVRFKVKEEIATAEGNVDEAKKWYDAAQNAADKAKLSPKQLTSADLQKGLNSFSEISEALEQAVDIVETLPRFRSQPNDSVDFNIWCYINYARKLKGLPTVEYSEVYKFYDDMKDEYLAQYGDPYGIFEDDTTVKNRENIQKFITLPSDYDDIENINAEDVDE